MENAVPANKDIGEGVESSSLIAGDSVWVGRALIDPFLRIPGQVTFTVDPVLPDGAPVSQAVLLSDAGAMAYSDLPGSLRVSPDMPLELRFRNRLASWPLRGNFSG